MAILRNGLFGGATGRLGNVVLYQRNGKTMMRMVGKPVKAPSLKQLVRRHEFKVVSVFLKVMKLFVLAGFEHVARAEGMYAMNKAVSVNKKNALKGEYPDVGIDFEKLVLSMGPLPMLRNPEVILEGHVLRFSWDTDLRKGWPAALDQVMLLVYFPEVEVRAGYESDRVCMILSGARRKDCAEVMVLPERMAAERIEVYMAMRSDDRRQVSASVYLGRFN